MSRTRTSGITALLLSLVVSASASAHGTVAFDRADQVFQCQRTNAGVTVTFKPPLLADASGRWAWIAYQLYGAEDFGSLAYGWTGWQYFGGNVWLAAQTNGAATHYSFGRASWLSDITLAANRSNTSSFGHRWWIYAHVLWEDGHVTTRWQSACAS